MLTVEDIKKYKDITKKLNVLTREYSKTILPDWKYYHGWSFSEVDDNAINIHYHYNDIVNNVEYETEYGTISVEIEILLNFNNEKINNYE